MKKVISIALVVLLAFSVIALVGCGNTTNEPADNGDEAAAALKFGMGVVSSYGEAKDADGDTDGAGEVNTTAVAVLLDADNKIVAIDLDTAQNKAAWTSEGKAVATDAYKTKYEIGADYGMAAYGKKHDGSEGKVLEWNEQAAAFDAALVGKTAAEFAAFAGEDTYAVGDLAAAGCTISVGDMIAAAEKAAK